MHARQQLGLAFSHIVDVMHVRVEGGVQTEIAEDDCQQQDDPEQPTMALGRHRGQLAKRQTLLPPHSTLITHHSTLHTPHQMRQENQDKEDGSHQHKGCKEA